MESEFFERCVIFFVAIPVIEVCDLSQSQKQALAIADNRIALNAGWDLNVLAIELKGLKPPRSTS